MATVDELIIKFIGDSKPLFNAIDKADNKIATFAKQAGTAIGGIFAFNAVKNFSTQLLKTADETGEFATSIGESVEQLSKFQEIAQRSGGSASGLRSSITSLSSKLTEARINGGESALLFQRLGISVSDTSGRVRKSTDVLLSLNKQFQNLSKTEQIGFGKKLGLDDGTIKMLQQTPKAMDELLKRQEKLGVITSEQAEKSDELNDLFSDFSQILKATSMMILTTLIPVIKGITNTLIEVVSFLRTHKTFIITFFLTLAGVITLNVIPALFAMMKATITAFAPYLLIGLKLAAITGFVALLIDDIINFMKGNDSLIGHIIKNLEVWFRAFLGFFVKVKSSIVGVFNDIKNNIKGFVQPIIDGLIGAFNGLKSQLDNIIKPIQDAISPVFSMLGKVGGSFGFGNQKLATQGVGGSNSVTDNKLQVDNITINTNGDADSIGSSIAGGLQDGWDKLLGRSNSGRKS